jgi:hypothetical protein
MNQRSIVRYLVPQALTPLAIPRRLDAALGREAVSSQSMTLHPWEAPRAPPNRPMTVSEPEPQLDHCDNAILLALAERLSALVPQLRTHPST